MKADNENDPLPFLTLSAATENVLRYLRLDEEKKEQRERETGRSSADDEKADRHREYVDKGLERIAAFERRASGLVRKDRFRR